MSAELGELELFSRRYTPMNADGKKYFRKPKPQRGVQMYGSVNDGSTILSEVVDLSDAILPACISLNRRPGSLALYGTQRIQQPLRQFMAKAFDFGVAPDEDVRIGVPADQRVVVFAIGLLEFAS
jgi:hypothetical protein